MLISVLGKGTESVAKEEVASVEYFSAFSVMFLLPLGSFLVASFT
jgi:hypothetical protein